MGLETGDFINQLDPNNPTPNDPKSQGDDHLRLIKKTVQQSFPNIDAAVTPTPAELNRLTGSTSAIIKVASNIDGEVQSGGGQYQGGDAIPGPTEGNLFYTLEYTALYASSLLKIETFLTLNNDSANGVYMVSTLHKDGGAAIAVGLSAKDSTASAFSAPIRTEDFYPAVDTDPHTFTVRGGIVVTLGNTTLNGIGSTRRFGGVLKSGIIISEYAQ